MKTYYFLATTFYLVSQLSILSAPSVYAPDQTITMTSNPGKIAIVLQGFGPTEFDKPNQPIPIIENGTNYTFNISFQQNGTYRTIYNVDYNVAIMLNGKEVYNAAKQFFNSSKSLYHGETSMRTTNGNTTLVHRFNETGFVTIKVSVLGINSTLIQPESSNFEFQVYDSRKIPEFPLGSLLPFVIGTTVVGIMTIKKYQKSIWA